MVKWISHDLRPPLLKFKPKKRSDALASKLEAVIDYLEKKNPKRNVVLRMIYEEVPFLFATQNFCSRALQCEHATHCAELDFVLIMDQCD